MNFSLLLKYFIYINLFKIKLINLNLGTLHNNLFFRSIITLTSIKNLQ